VATLLVQSVLVELDKLTLDVPAVAHILGMSRSGTKKLFTSDPPALPARRRPGPKPGRKLRNISLDRALRADVAEVRDLMEERIERGVLSAEAREAFISTVGKPVAPALIGT